MRCGCCQCHESPACSLGPAGALSWWSMRGHKGNQPSWNGQRVLCHHPRLSPGIPRIPWELNSFSSRWEKPSLPVSTKHSWNPSLSHHPPVGLDGHSGPGQTLFSAEHSPSHNFNSLFGLFHQPSFLVFFRELSTPVFPSVSKGAAWWSIAVPSEL